MALHYRPQILERVDVRERSVADIRLAQHSLSSTPLWSCAAVSASELDVSAASHHHHTSERRESSILAASEKFGSKRRTCVLASELQPRPPLLIHARLAGDMHDLALVLRYHHSCISEGTCSQ